MTSDDGDEDWTVTDMPSAIRYMGEALPRLREELDCVQGHWDTFLEMFATRGYEWLTEYMAAGTVSDEIMEAAHHTRMMVDHLGALSEYHKQVAAIVFQWICPPHVQQQMMVDAMERYTQQPYKVVGEMAGGFVLGPDEIVVPDEVPDEWSTDE